MRTHNLDRNMFITQRHTLLARWIARSLTAWAALSAPSAFADKPIGCPADIYDFPGNLAFQGSNGLVMEQGDLHNGVYTFSFVFQYGAALADSRWNECDGEGRPATTGGGAKRAPGQPNQTRVSGPEATSCSGCHAQPRSGGSGDFVANTFNGAENLDPVSFSVDPAGSNERNTTGMFGEGAIEMLAREMTSSLKSQAASWVASSRYADGWKTFKTKGVTFDAYFTNKQVTDARGINTDLIVRPFGAGGTKVSLREFNVGALNRHHGIQAEEAYDMVYNDSDFDEDGVKRELTVGEVTALTIWSAALNMPIQQLPSNVVGNRAEQQIALDGEKLFNQVGCGGCHTPSMVLNNRMYCEPNPYNPPGIFSDTSQSYCMELDTLPRDPQKGLSPAPTNLPATLKTYTDLKRHHMCDDPGYPGAIRSLCNEQFPEGRPSQDGYPGQEFFLTADLWQVAESAPWGHDGRYNSMSSIILAHAGEARTSRDAYAALTGDDQIKVIKFLRTLRILDQHVRVHDG